MTKWYIMIGVGLLHVNFQWIMIVHDNITECDDVQDHDNCTVNGCVAYCNKITACDCYEDHDSCTVYDYENYYNSTSCDFYEDHDICIACDCYEDRGKCNAFVFLYEEDDSWTCNCVVGHVKNSAYEGVVVHSCTTLL